jgi:hypothetical protein
VNKTSTQRFIRIIKINGIGAKTANLFTADKFSNEGLLVCAEAIGTRPEIKERQSISVNNEDSFLKYIIFLLFMDNTT